MYCYNSGSDSLVARIILLMILLIVSAIPTHSTLRMTWKINSKITSDDDVIALQSDIYHLDDYCLSYKLHKYIKLYLTHPNVS